MKICAMVATYMLLSENLFSHDTRRCLGVEGGGGREVGRFFVVYSSSSSNRDTPLFTAPAWSVV